MNGEYFLHSSTSFNAEGLRERRSERGRERGKGGSGIP